ncbi:MAG: hypothetical protein V4592_25180 [Bacteroidota bacterium]
MSIALKVFLLIAQAISKAIQASREAITIFPFTDLKKLFIRTYLF